MTNALLKHAQRPLLIALGLLGLSACGYVDAYEEAVHDWEPRYCYQHLGGIECYREPVRNDDARLVNYFGPHPSRFDAPEKPEPREGHAPAKVDYFARDPEPVPSDTAIYKARSSSGDTGLTLLKAPPALSENTPPSSPATPPSKLPSVEDLLEPTPSQEDLSFKSPVSGAL